MAYFLYHPVQIHVQIRCLQAFSSYVIGLRHFPNGFDDLLGNEVTTPELTIADSGRYLDIAMDNDAPTDARIDVYMSNSLGHHLPGRIFSRVLPPLVEEVMVSSRLLTLGIRKPNGSDNCDVNYIMSRCQSLTCRLSAVTWSDVVKPLSITTPRSRAENTYRKVENTECIGLCDIYMWQLLYIQ